MILVAVNVKHKNFCIYGWTLLKILIILKKASNKSCLELNFIQKVRERTYLPPLPQSGAMGIERLIWLKYYIVLKQEITFNLGLNYQKYASHQKKLQIKVVWNWISYKKVRECICLSPFGVELWGSSAYSNRTLYEITMKNVWNNLPSLLRQIDIDTHWVFWRKLKSEQFLFETVFYIISIFRSIHPQSISNVTIFGAPPPLLREIDKALIEVSVGNWSLNNFYLNLFFILSVFFAAFSPKVNLLSHSSILNMAIFGAP